MNTKNLPCWFIAPGDKTRSTGTLLWLHAETGLGVIVQTHGEHKTLFCHSRTAGRLWGVKREKE